MCEEHTLEYPDGGREVVDAPGGSEGSDDDAGGGDEIVGESVVEVTLQLEDVLDVLELLLVSARARRVSKKCHSQLTSYIIFQSSQTSTASLFLRDPVTLLQLCMNSVEPLSKYALFPRLHHSSISLPAIAISNIFLPSQNTANTGTAYLAVNSSKDSSWWGSWASTSPANLPAETEKAARWTGCCTKSALWAGRAKGAARARVALRMRAETDIVRVVLGGAEMRRSRVLFGS